MPSLLIGHAGQVFQHRRALIDSQAVPGAPDAAGIAR
jgi:hypothetical protein